MTESKLTKQIKRSLFDFIRKNRSYGLFVAYEVSILSNWFDHAKGNRSERCDVVSWDGNEHFVCYDMLIDIATGEIVDDAQGYGYRTKQKAP